MGQELACPCAFTREEQTKKLMTCRHDFGFLRNGDSSVTDPSLELSPKKSKKMSHLQYILNKGEQLLKKYTSRTPSLSTPSPFGFTDDSAISHDTHIVVVCEVIDDFEEFLAKYNALYNNEFVPSLIAPHPFLKKAIVIFQSANSVPSFTLAKGRKFIEFKRNLKDAPYKDSYQFLVKFFKQCAEQGLQFLGYYLDIQLNYHFIFYESLESQEDVLSLHFETLDNLNCDELEYICKDASDMNYKFRGVITLLGDSKNYSFGIFEKRKLNLEEPIVIDIPGDCLGSEKISTELSRKIDLGCRSDGLELAGLVPDYERRLLYIILSR